MVGQGEREGKYSQEFPPGVSPRNSPALLRWPRAALQLHSWNWKQLPRAAAVAVEKRAVSVRESSLSWCL